MAAATKLTTNYFKTLSNFTLLNALDADKLVELTEKSTVKQFATGASLPTNQQTKIYYLLSGTIEVTRRGQTEQINAGSKSALNPVCYQETQCIAVAKTPVSMMCVDRDLLELLQSWDNDQGYEVDEIDEWPQHPALAQLPPSKRQSLMAVVETVATKAGQVIIKQDDSHDKNYYIIEQGSCSVSRRPSPDAQTIELATLDAGQGFGEEALIGQAPRNASVSMNSDGLLLKIGQQNFNHLLESSFIKKISYAHAARLKEQGADTLDIRSEAAFINNGIGIHAPLSTLRRQAKRLDKNNKYITVCEDGKKSAIAAFLLSQQGFDVYVLKNGLKAIEETEKNDKLAVANKKPAIVNDEHAIQLLKWRTREMERRVHRLEEKYQTEIKQLNHALNKEKGSKQDTLKKRDIEIKQIKKQLKTEKQLFTKIQKKAEASSKTCDKLKQKNEQLQQELANTHKRLSLAKKRTKNYAEKTRPFVYVKDEKKPTSRRNYVGILLITLAALYFGATSYFGFDLAEQLNTLILRF